MAQQVKGSWSRRIATAELNRFLEALQRQLQPPVHKNRRPKLFYGSQVKSRPPTFMVVANYPKSIPAHYRRFMINQMRACFGFEGTPIKVFFRERNRRTDPELD